jgi:hypothetical protein
MRALASVVILGALLSAAPPAKAGDPAVGDCLLAAEASLKLRAEHKLRLTRTQLLVCSAASCPAEVRQECMRRIDEVNAASPTIVFEVKNGAGKELSAVKVTADGQVIADHLDGSALPIDPGAHEFTFESAGVPPLTETIILHEGEKDRRETVVLGGSAGTPQPVSTQDDTTTTTDSGGESKSGGGGQTLRTLGIVAGAAGVVGLGVGTVFGLLASSSWKDAQHDCPSHAGCPAKAMNERNTALTDATVSTIGFIAGGVLLAGGLTLFFTAPKGGSTDVGLRVTPGGFVVSGGF